jgi:hypothetical protein
VKRTQFSPHQFRVIATYLHLSRSPTEKDRLRSPTEKDRHHGCCRRQRRRKKNGEVYYKYEPRVNLNNKRLPLKEYDTLEEAALVHDIAKYCLGIKHGRLNSTLERYIHLQRISSELPPSEIVELVRNHAKAIGQQETYQKACSMPPSDVSHPPNPSLTIEDLEVFTESQDVQAWDPTNNYLSSPSNQSLSIEGIIIFIDLQDGPTCNQNLKDVLCIIW